MIEIPLHELPPGTLKQVKLDGEPLCVANVEGKVYAVSDRCTHAGIPLSSGELEGCQVICPWHGAMFDLRNGHPTCGPAHDPLRCYNVRIHGGTITITAEVQASIS